MHTVLEPHQMSPVPQLWPLCLCTCCSSAKNVLPPNLGLTKSLCSVWFHSLWETFPGLLGQKSTAPPPRVLSTLPFSIPPVLPTPPTSHHLENSSSFPEIPFPHILLPGGLWSPILCVLPVVSTLGMSLTTSLGRVGLFPVYFP